MAAARNATLYRKSPDGQEKGPWSDDAHGAFMRALRERGANKDWGLFSVLVPHRNGIQCADYYRRLIKDGDVSDPHYSRDSGGAMRFRRVFGCAADRVRFSFVVHRDRSGTFAPLPFRAARALVPAAEAPAWTPPGGGGFVGAVVDPQPGRPAADLVRLEGTLTCAGVRLVGQARLPVAELVPHGIVCCWVPSPSYVVPLLDVAADVWKAKLVETVVWVHGGRSDKTDVFVFRRAGKTSALRLQQTCDVILSATRPCAQVCDLVSRMVQPPPGARQPFVYVWGPADLRLESAWTTWAP